MQDRYVGDANDFVKYAVLRRLARLTTDQQVCRLGICWYLTDPAIVDAVNPQEDGRRIDYLLGDNNNNWRLHADRELFDLLRKLLVIDGRIDERKRRVANIQTAGVFPSNSLFFDEPVPQTNTARQQWHQRALKALEGATTVFLDPDNCVSDFYTHSVRGGKWAAPHEVRAYLNEFRSVVWISHPRQQPRSLHHVRTMATIEQIGSLFCSVYFGHCGFHFLLNDAHIGIARALRQFVRDAQEWGTCRYFDSSGESINPNIEAGPPEVPDDAQFQLAEDADAGIWEYVEAARVNDPGALWVGRNPWIRSDCHWEIAFLLLHEQRISTVRFIPFDNPDYRHGIRPLDDPQNLTRWRLLSEGASNTNQRVYPALVRRCPPETPT